MTKNSNGMKDLFSQIERNTTDRIISVSEYLDQVNRQLKSHTARILGEVTGLQECPGRSYLFFSIKDKADQSTVKCFMWKRDYTVSGVTLADGLEIIVSAYPNIYKPNGTISLQVESVELVGEGALQIAYEKLKSKLEQEGLFDESKKRDIPTFPKTIGVITSKSGAVINDFLSNIGTCGFEIMFVDSKVEGADAVKELLSAVKTLAKKKIDVLVMMRGGGSLESFQAFNNELLVRAVARFPAPVLTGIGHDKDIPLVSLVSDKNVSTPTAVANLLSAGWSEARLHIKIMEQKMYGVFENVLRDKLYFLEQSENVMERGVRNIIERFRFYTEAMHRAEDRISSAISHIKSRLEDTAKILSGYSPERQLKLGWSLVHSASGTLVRSVRDVNVGDTLEISVADGRIEAQRTAS